MWGDEGQAGLDQLPGLWVTAPPSSARGAGDDGGTKSGERTSHPLDT